MRIGPDRFRRKLPSLATSKDGSVAVIFAVALVPVVIAAGVGLDVSRAMSARTNLQDALDSTALALAHMPAGSTHDELQAKADAWLHANLDDRSLGPVTLDVRGSTGEMVIEASSYVPTTLTAITGVDRMPVVARSTAKWGLGHVEVALVLDNTGSMAGDKLTRLKTAANELVDTLASSTPNTDPNALKIGVVPFSMTVRLGSSYRTSTWMTGTAPPEYFTAAGATDLFITRNTNWNRFSKFDGMNQTWAGCIESRPAPYDVQDTAPNTAVPASLFVPFFAPDEPDDDTVIKSQTSRKTTYYSFDNDYLNDGISPTGTSENVWRKRQGNPDKYTRSPSRGSGPNAGCTMATIQRLTTNMNTVKSKITAMQATGNTNVPIGMMWGWHVLSPNLPFGDGAGYGNRDTKKFAVLLTDGDNTNDDSGDFNQSHYSSLGYIWQGRLVGAGSGSTPAQRTKAMDDRLVLLCSNMKAAGITVYTVRIDMAGTSAPDALRSCASSSDKFYDIDSTGLSAAFNAIAGSIGQLRIAE